MIDQVFSEHEYLTVRELADLLRLKERKVYDLAASGEVPCSRATGKLLFPAAEIRQWIEHAKSGGHADPGPMPQIVLGSHDPLLDWTIRQSRCGLATFFDGSLDGLERFARGEGVAAGMHVYDAGTSGWNVPAVAGAAGARNAVLVTFASRNRGLVVRPGERRPERIADLAGLRMVPRQRKSGSDGIFRALAAAEEVDLAQVNFTEVERTEDDAVEAVRRGVADVTFGLESMARAFGLDFVPLIEEQYALLVDRKAWFEPPFQALLGFCATERFRQRATEYGGYDVTHFGEVVWNA